MDLEVIYKRFWGTLDIVINNVNFFDLPEALIKREKLARLKTSINMSGHKK